MTATVIDDTRASLGTIGAFLPNIFGHPVPPVAEQVSSVLRLEQAGFRTAWNNEGLGSKDGLIQLALLLAATDRITLGPAIASMWARPPETAHGGMAMLAEAYPGRVVFGLGVGYPMQAEVIGAVFEHPVRIAREYFRRMDTPPPGMLIPARAYPRLLAANGPQMLRLAAEIADGALPTLVPPSYTTAARAILGPDKLLVVGLTAVFGQDVDDARRRATQFVSQIVTPGSWSERNLRGLGFDTHELAGPSERVVNAIVAFGDAEAIAARAREHLQAGADHVRVGLIAPDFAEGINQLERLAPAIVGLSGD